MWKFFCQFRFRMFELSYLSVKIFEDKKHDVCGLDQLETIGILGKGAFGLVSLVVDPNTNKSYALKAIKKAQIVELGQQSHIINEKRVMEKMNNPFLVNLRGTYKDKYKVYFLLDVCLGNSTSPQDLI